MTLLHHGGRLKEVAKQYHIAETLWVDLSTGVSPWHYPIPEIPAQYWNRLPEEADDLLDAAAKYYGGKNPLPVAGSQSAIQTLPKVLAFERGGAGKVLLPLVGYKEHERAWRMAGWQVDIYGDDLETTNANGHPTPTTAQIASCDVLLVINPNNPSAHLIPPHVLTSWLADLTANGSYLVIDEAFMDITPQHSMMPALATSEQLIILRSVGKFFGLAGIRAGFVFCPRYIRDKLETQLGPWCVNGPARFICTHAFKDIAWHALQTHRLEKSSQRLANLLSILPGMITGTGLFQTVYLTVAKKWHIDYCQHGILTRLTDEQDALRFGIPETEEQWMRLEQVTLLLVKHR
ncbi:threonine-phosphate decarboxylase CobD [Shewanella youngdeokensis]|uniref:threonine-phosphate decarboxylase n=1 Tax=Shewanella youngdeokensis TaxID=2999068 RepID=A0ABZ0K2K0_9GAMM|nr:threonine-phosphate decarboxylase CobD [Shewanella sp. DAU334]